MDVLFVSTSCKPYSKARTGRRNGTAEHSDAGLVDAFIGIMKRFRPKAAVFEQVAGFAQPESKTNPDSPLMQLTLRVAEELPTYTIITFYSAGTVFLCVTRDRIFIVFLDEAQNPAVLLPALEQLVKVFF